MNVIRRGYLYLVCAISLQAAVWAVIGLLRSLLPLGRTVDPEAIAFLAAVAIVALPLFLFHWRLAGRDAARDTEERGSALRRLYLYGMLALFLIPLLANTFDLVSLLIIRAFGWPLPVALMPPAPTGTAPQAGPDPIELAAKSLAAIMVLVVLIAYHWRIIKADAAVVPDGARTATVRRLFVLGFSALGAALAGVAAMQILRWLMIFAPGTDLIVVGGRAVLAREVARLTIGLPVWFVFWNWAQRLRAFGGEEEQQSALRQVYLFAFVFVGLLGVVVPTAMIITGVLRGLLGLPPSGHLSGPLPILLVSAVSWAYHARVLREDTATMAEAPRQAAVRRLYVYLVAAVGLAAFLVGLVGIVQVLVRGLAASGAGAELREQLAWSTAAIVIGLPVWYVSWRRAQAAAVQPESAGRAERTSLVRRLYLYLVLFVSTVTVLSGAVFLVYRVLSLILGLPGEADLPTRLAESVAYTLIGALVWAYHGSVLRADGRLAAEERSARLAELRTAVLDVGDGRLGRRVIDALRRELPDLPVEPLGLTPVAAEAMGGGAAPGEIAERVDEAAVVIAPWDLTVPDDRETAGHDEARRAIAGSPARKLLIPRAEEGWSWVGVEPRGEDELVHQTVHGLRLLADGREIEPDRPPSAGQMIGIAVGALLLFVVIVIPIVGLMLGGGLRYLFGP